MLFLSRYDAIVELTRVLNSQSISPRQTQVKTRQILQSLFPSWLPPAFKVGCLSAAATESLFLPKVSSTGKLGANLSDV